MCVCAWVHVCDRENLCVCVCVVALPILMQPIYDPPDDSLASVTYTMQATLHNRDCFRPTVLERMILSAKQILQIDVLSS